MGHKILLADDSITIQKVIELTFSDEDFELHTVGNGQKAVDEIRSIMPHIVLCDIIMPEKNGYEVCEFIKSSADLKHIPVLLLTGAFEPFDQERARAAGCDGFLAKPFEPQTLISKVKELLERTPAAAAPAAVTPKPQAPAPRPAPAAAPSPAPAPPVRPPAPPPPPAFGDADERTVMMSPPVATPPPPPARRPQAPASTPPPPPVPAAEVDSGGLDDAFAVEAGERELMMDPGDHTVLLGGSEKKSAPEPEAGGDDIWGEVVEPAPLEPEEDSSTVFMSAPPPISPPSAPEYGEVQYENDDLDSTWRMPNANESEESSSAPDYGGFEEFAEPLTPDVVEEEPSFEMPPPLTPPPPRKADYDEPADPFLAAAAPPGFDSDRTVDSAVDDGGYETMSPGAGFDTYGEPEPEPELVEPEPEPEPMFEPDNAAEPFDELDSSPESSMPPPMDDFADSGFDEPSPELSSNHSSGNSATPVDDDLIEKIAQRVLDRLSEKVVQEIAWEVVPDLAEGLIRREIEALKAKIPK
jgi:CheY-like chemotaxis protein